MLAVFAVILLALSGCAKKNLPELPPAAGEGAPAATKIPTLKELDKSGPSVEKAVGAVGTSKVNWV